LKLTFLQSATVIIEDKETKILCDPWLENNEYFGSWVQYPVVKLKPEYFDDIDYIYVSHVHPDHCSEKTLDKLKKDIPIIIRNFPQKFLKNYLQNLGFEVIEAEHNKRIHLKQNLHINILASDDCDPTICGRLFACNFDKSRFGTNQIDTMCAIDNEKETIVNTNDCPFEIGEQTAKKVKAQYNNIDLLLVGYSGASSYPHCYIMSNEEKQVEAIKKKNFRLQGAENYIKLFKPRYFMPFAGRYVLAGRLYLLNSFRGEPELEEGFDILSSKVEIEDSQGILLNPYSSFDLSTGKSSDKYRRVDMNEKLQYIKNNLSKYKFDYEKEVVPECEELIELLPASYARFEDHRKDLDFVSHTKIILDLSKNSFLMIPCDGSGYKIIDKNKMVSIKKYVRMKMHPRLLKWLLQGPKKAHWNNVEVGSHIEYERVPNVYERGVYHCLNFFHS